jgi:transforming growth factor-beta-induced protein
LSTFVSLVEAADLSDVFSCAGPFTVLAPSNTAFEGIDDDTMDELLRPENKEKLQNILLYHVVPGLKLSAALTEGSLDTLLEGQDLDVTLSPITFNLRSEVTEADIVACNGNLIVLSDVLVPGTSFWICMTSDNITSPLSIEPDVCDSFAFSGDRRKLTDGVCSPNVFEVAQHDPSISLTLTMLDRINLSDIFLCNGPFTALLPTNDAWSSLDPSALEYLLRPDNQELLEDLLLYHILPGVLTSSSDADGPADTLLPGALVEVGTVVFTFNGSLTSKRDIQACNGLFHLLDNVLLPFALRT